MQRLNFEGTEVDVKVITSISPNRIQIFDSEKETLHAMATVSLQELSLVEGYVAIDYMHEKDMLKFLLENDIVEPPVTYLKSWEDGTAYPICKIKTL